MSNKTAQRGPRVLDEDAACEYCGSSASTFQKLRMRGTGPAYVKMGRRVVPIGWREGDAA